MTVLQVCAFAAPNPGNFIATLTHLEQALLKQGIRTIYAFADGAEGKPWCQEIQRRTKVYFLPTAKARILPKTYRILKNIYRENDIAITHSHFELYDIPATVTAPKGTKIFWHLHDAIKLNYQKASLSRKCLTRVQYGVFGKRPVLLSVSEEHAEFVNSLGFPETQTHYFPNGINTARIHPTALHKPERNFLMFGWEVKRKGVDLVVEAASRLTPPCSITIIGQEQCKNYLDEVPHADTIRFSAPVDNINELYQHTKCFLHVSRAEGLSYALLEVIYAGIPVICSDIPENRFAKAFKNVIFVPNEDSEAIATAMEQILSGPDNLQEEDVRFNRKLIEETYSLHAWTNKIMHFYLENTP